MRKPSTDTTSRRAQTSPVVTLQEDLQEPCEDARSNASASRKSSRWMRAMNVAAIGLLGIGLAACSDDDKSDIDDPEECEGEACDDVKQCLAVAAVSAEDGALAVVDLETLDVETNITTVHHDVGFAWHEDRIYAINRWGADNLQAINLDDDYATEWQYSLGEGANPQDLSIHGDRGFIPLLGTSKIAVLNLAADNEDDFLEETISIDPIDDWDGSIADLGSTLLHNGVLYVVSQGINDSWECEEDAHGQVLAFDADTLEPAEVFDGEATLDLELCNAGGIVAQGDTLYIQSLGAYRYSAEGTPEDDGGIEAYDLAADQHLGVILTETEANESDIFQIYASKDGQGLWVNLAGGDAFSDQKLHFLDLSGDTPELSDAFYEGYVWSITETDEELFVTDRDEGSEGLYVLDKETRELISEEGIDVGQAPRGSLLFERKGSCF